MSQLEHHRRIDYVEFPVADVAVARRFYSYDFALYRPELMIEIAAEAVLPP